MLNACYGMSISEVKRISNMTTTFWAVWILIVTMFTINYDNNKEEKRYLVRTELHSLHLTENLLVLHKEPSVLEFLKPLSVSNWKSLDCWIQHLPPEENSFFRISQYWIQDISILIWLEYILQDIDHATSFYQYSDSNCECVFVYQEHHSNQTFHRMDNP